MRLSKKQWLDGGLDLLVQAGPESVKIDKLCKHMQVTKGSFYHHFGNRDQFIAELLSHWADVNTHQIIEQSNQQADVEAKRQLMSELVDKADFQSERAIRGWACFDAQVKQSVHLVDHARIGFIQSLMSGISHHCPSDQAAAELIYGTFIGFMLLPDSIERDRAQYLEGVLAQFIMQR